ncbi:tripartite motif-containing protein 16-like [Astatotilapia calliptera]|uniref:B box-type domain-containing protein n=1 Tax=Astatotilapia calliptera TaxID=8154 RepID=A0AAX7TAL0_ASTCA|nr:tripartite motif-containing protein 16-like [Astatotilapia calliptera]
MSENIKMDLQTVLCDMCTEDRKPAKKTCMKCEISMCVQHLQAHLTTPVLLQTHPLTEPMALCGNTKCSQHGKLLEYYCLDDMTCVCVSCAIEDQHRLHNMKTFSTAHKELLEKLKAEQLILQEKTDDENVSLEKWEQSEREKLGRCSVRLIEAVTKLRDISLTSVQSSVSARMVSLKTSKSSLEAAQKEKDTFSFLQMYSQVQQDVEKAKAVDLSKGLEPGSHRDKLVEEMRQNGEKMVKQASQLWGSLLTLVDPEHHQELVPTGSDTIFEPQSLGPGMSLSTDNRKVFHSQWMKFCSSCLFLIKSTLPVPDFKRWVISISKDCDWTIGVCDDTYATSMKDGNVYGLRCQGNQLFSLTTESSWVMKETQPVMGFGMPKTETRQQHYKVSQQVINTPGGNVEPQMTRPQIVEVVWSFPNSLSFFSRIGQHQRINLLTVTISSTSSDLKPFVCLQGLEKEATNVLLTTATRKMVRRVQQQYQNQWKCSCRKIYGESTDGYHYGGSFYPMHSKSTCSCGNIIGVARITAVLCELL